MGITVCPPSASREDGPQKLQQHSDQGEAHGSKHQLLPLPGQFAQAYLSAKLEGGDVKVICAPSIEHEGRLCVRVWDEVDVRELCCSVIRLEVFQAEWFTQCLPARPEDLRQWLLTHDRFDGRYGQIVDGNAPFESISLSLSAQPLYIPQSM